MSVYTLINNATGTSALPPSPVVRPISVAERQLPSVVNGNVLDPNTAITPPAQQAFVLTASGTASVSATAQIYGSNDNVNWVAIGAAITAAGTTSASVGASGTVPFAFYGATISSISGTGCVAKLTMSC